MKTIAICTNQREVIKKINLFFSNTFNILKVEEINQLTNIYFDFLVITPIANDRDYLQNIKEIQESSNAKIIGVTDFISEIYYKILEENGVKNFVSLNFTKQEIQRQFDGYVEDVKYKPIILFLKENKVNEKSKGFVYLTEIISMFLENEDLLHRSISSTYEVLSVKYDCSVDTIERNIRTALKTHNHFFDTEYSNREIIFNLVFKLKENKVS